MRIIKQLLMALALIIGVKSHASIGLGINEIFFESASYHAETAPVPETGTMVLLSFGLLSLAIFVKRRMKD